MVVYRSGCHSTARILDFTGATVCSLVSEALMFYIFIYIYIFISVNNGKLKLNGELGLN